jgi:hypothetical protein
MFQTIEFGSGQNVYAVSSNSGRTLVYRSPDGVQDPAPTIA